MWYYFLYTMFCLPPNIIFFNWKGKGNLKGNFNHKSKLCNSLLDILFDKKNDEISFFVLYMESINSSNYVKFLLDLNNFEQTFDSIKCKKIYRPPCENCESNSHSENEFLVKCKCQEDIYTSKIKTKFQLLKLTIVSSFFFLIFERLFSRCDFNIFKVHINRCQILNRSLGRNHFGDNL